MSVQAGTGRGMRIALIASLGVNLVVAGVLAGALLRGEHGPVRLAVSPELRGAISALPDTDRDRVRAAMRDAGPTERGERMERLRGARAFAEAVMADPFDRDAVAAVFDARSTAGEQMRSAALEALLDSLAQMSPEARRDFLERMRQEGRGARDAHRGPEHTRGQPGN